MRGLGLGPRATAYGYAHQFVDVDRVVGYFGESQFGARELYYGKEPHDDTDCVQHSCFGEAEREVDSIVWASRCCAIQIRALIQRLGNWRKSGEEL